MGTLWQDIRFGLRVLYKSPGFTAVAILTLALGIGANTAIFSFIDAWLIKPLPYPQADRLMVLLSHDTKKGLTGWGVTSTADFVDYQQQSTSFDQLVPWTAWAFNLTSDGPPERIVGGRVGWTFFQTLDAKPILGRAFLPQESQPGNDHEVILGEGLWKSRFASDAEDAPDRILIGPVFSRHPFTYNGHVTGVLIIGVREFAPAGQRDPQRLEVVRRNGVPLHDRIGLALGKLVAVNREGVHIGDEAHGGAVRKAGRFHAWQSSHALEKRFVELNSLGIIVADLGGIHPEIQHLARLEAEVLMLHPHETPRE